MPNEIKHFRDKEVSVSAGLNRHKLLYDLTVNNKDVTGLLTVFMVNGFKLIHISRELKSLRHFYLFLKTLFVWYELQDYCKQLNRKNKLHKNINMVKT